MINSNNTPMKWYWTWSGKCFGYRDGDALRTYYGKHVGNFVGDIIYGTNGKYLGEVMNDNSLITCTSKKGWYGHSFAPYANYIPYAPYANNVGYAMYAGYEDFPHPKDFQ
jgi:hypothetical protein